MSKNAIILHILQEVLESMKFSEKVLELRGRLQITQVQLAEMLGVSYSTVNRWEGGHYEATKLVRHKFDDLCKKHGIMFENKEVGE